MMNWIKKYSMWATAFIFGVALIAVYKTFNSFDALRAVLRTIVSAISPFIGAFIIAYMLNIPAKKIESLLRKYAKHEFIKNSAGGLSIACVYVLFIAAIFLTLGSLLPAIYKNLIEMYENLPAFVNRLTNFLKNLQVVKKLGINVDSLNLFEMISKAANLNSVGRYAEGVKSITNGLFDAFIAVIASIYMLLDKKRILDGMKKWISIFSKNKKNGVVWEHISSVNTIFTQYIYSRLICCIIVAILVSLELLILKDKYALLLGIFVGFMNIIPYFGAIISWAIAAVVMFISGGFVHALWGSIIMLVIQQLDGNLISPKILGSRLEIRPLAVIIAVSVGGKLFGFIGMLISVPVAAILRAIISEFADSRVKDLEENTGKEAAPTDA